MRGLFLSKEKAAGCWNNQTAHKITFVVNHYNEPISNKQVYFILPILSFHAS